MGILATLLGSYLIGAIPFGYLVARIVKGVDIRQHGSGNIGATNVARVLGWPYFILVFALDFAKGAGPVLVARWLDGRFSSGAGASLPQDGLATLAGLVAILGHMWPIYLGFRGGKGVATSAGVIAFLAPAPALVAVAAWVVVFLSTRYVSLSSMVAAGVLALAQLGLWWSQAFGEESSAVTLFCAFAAVLVVLRHRSNLVRLWQGAEPRVGRRSEPEAPAPP